MKSLYVFLLGSIIATSAFAANLDRIDPVGDENLGFLIVNSVLAKTVQTADAHVNVGGKNVLLAQTQRLPEGEYTIALQARDPQTKAGISLGAQKVSVAKTLTTTIELGGLEANISAGVLDVDFGPKAEWKVSALNGTDFSFTKWIEPMQPNIQVLQVFPAEYTFSIPAIPLFTPVMTTVTAGQLSRKHINVPEYRATLEIREPANVEFPDAVTAAEQDMAVFLVQRSKPPRLNRNVRTPKYVSVGSAYSQSGLEDIVEFTKSPLHASYRFFPAIEAGKELYYELVVNNVAAQIQIPAGKTSVFQLKRLDVNDVYVTKEDGTSEMVPGEYEVFTKTFNSSGGFYWEPLFVPELMVGNNTHMSGRKSFPTKTGITLPAGEYKVVVKYMTKEGQKQTEHLVTLK